MKRLVCLIALLGGCASGASGVPAYSPKSYEDEMRSMFMARAVVLARPTLDLATAPELTPDVGPGLKIVRVKLAVCTDVAGKPSATTVDVSSGNQRFDRAVQAWVAKAPFTQALNIDRQPIESCDSKVDLIWQRDLGGEASAGPVARPVNPLLLPEYPAAARRRRDVGPSDAKLCIDAQGRVTDIEESASPSEVLGDAFDAWVRAMPFQPAYQDGVPVAACGLAFGIYWNLP